MSKFEPTFEFKVEPEFEFEFEFIKLFEELIPVLLLIWLILFILFILFIKLISSWPASASSFKIPLLLNIIFTLSSDTKICFIMLLTIFICSFGNNSSHTTSIFFRYFIISLSFKIVKTALEKHMKIAYNIIGW